MTTPTHDLALARAERDAWQSTCEELHAEIARRTVEIEAHLAAREAADQRARSLDAALTAEREASKGLVAQVDALRAAAAESEYAFRNASKQLSVALDERDDARRITGEAWNARDAALASANMYQSDAERQTRELAKLRAELAELRARPVLTYVALSNAWHKAIDTVGNGCGVSDIMSALGSSHTLPSPDRAEELFKEYLDAPGSDVEAMRHALAALAKLSPAPAREVAPTLVAVSDEELVELHTVAWDKHPGNADSSDIAAIRAVRAKLGAAEVTEERIKAALHDRFKYEGHGDWSADARAILAHLRATAAKGG